jgi:hypothetical protein
MATNETNFVTHVYPINLTGVRDEAVQALILLAASLGWNVLMKRGQPAVLIAHDGMQKRIPTDTSIRMSVFQTALSTIMVHSGDQEPTLALIDEIIKMTKPSKDHQRRLRLAVGETPSEHRERVANAERSAPDVPKGEHLTQRIEMPVEEDTSALREGLVAPPAGAADGGDHGEIVSREPFHAHYSGHTGYGAMTYQSEVSLERVWADGYRDYECTFCGKAFKTPRSVGGHRQVHTKAGEAEAIGAQPWKRPGAIKGRDTEWSMTKQARPTAETVEFVEELPPTKAELHEQEEPKPIEPVRTVALDHDPEYKALDIVYQIIELVLPTVQDRANTVIAALTEERDAALSRLAAVEGEFDALVEMLTSRKKDQ